MNIFKPRMNVLPPAQVELWPKLISLTDLGMTLYGGTAVALRLGHRESVDFDFFTDKEISKDSLFSSIPFLKESTVIQDEKNTLTVFTKNGVKVSMFGGFNFGRYGEPEMTDDGALLVASLDDLMGHKAKVILDRIAAKDYIDIAEMIKAGVSFSKGLSTARELFSPSFAPSIALRTITYFEGGDLSSLTDDTKRLLINEASSVNDLPNVSLKSKSLSIALDEDEIKILRNGLDSKSKRIEVLLGSRSADRDLIE
jgi:hypothetical protein